MGPFGLRVQLPLSTCLPHTLEASHCPFDCRTSSREAVNTEAFGLTRPGIKPESTVSEADALSTRPLVN